MFILTRTDDHKVRFENMKDLKDYIEEGHAKTGEWDWISEITDDKGRSYGCTWRLKIERI